MFKLILFATLYLIYCSSIETAPISFDGLDGSLLNQTNLTVSSRQIRECARILNDDVSNNTRSARWHYCMRMINSQDSSNQANEIETVVIERFLEDSQNLTASNSTREKRQFFNTANPRFGAFGPGSFAFGFQPRFHPFPFGGNSQFGQGRERPFEGRERPFEGRERPFEGRERPFGGRERPFEGRERPFGEGVDRQFGEGVDRQFGEGNRQFGEGRNRQSGEGRDKVKIKTIENNNIIIGSGSVASINDNSVIGKGGPTSVNNNNIVSGRGDVASINSNNVANGKGGPTSINNNNIASGSGNMVAINNNNVAQGQGGPIGINNNNIGSNDRGGSVSINNNNVH